MITIRVAPPVKILLAVDGSSHSTAAINLLTRITWPADTTVYVLAFVSDRLPLMDRSAIPEEMINETVEIGRWRDWSVATLLTNNAAAQLRSCNLTVETEVVEGNPAQVLQQRAIALSVDLAVVGAKDFGPADKFSLSSTAHQLTHHADHSVLIARPSTQIRPLNTLIAVDGSHRAWRAVEFLSFLSLPQWAKVTVVNIIENQAEGASGLPSSRAVLENERYTARVIEHLHDNGVQARRLIRVGQPADEILTIAQEQKADLIVIGLREESEAGFYEDSVTQKIVNYAPCSVLAVHQRREEIYANLQNLWGKPAPIHRQLAGMSKGIQGLVRGQIINQWYR
jgi:nucleotide-binding universal stress UspA family protein